MSLEIELDTSVSDAELEEYMRLLEEGKRVNQRIQEIKEKCKRAGSFCSQGFVCSVYEQEQVRLVGLGEVAAAIGRTVLEQYDLIKVISFCIVKVTRRNL